MPPQTECESFDFSMARETQTVDNAPRGVRTERSRRRRGLLGTLGTLFFSFVFRILNINWFLSFLGLVLVEVEEHGTVPVGKRKNEDLIENVMKKLKNEVSSEECLDEENSRERKLQEVRSNLIKDFTMKLWNMTPVIDFANKDEDDTYINSPLRVITPSRSFDNLLNLSEQESLSGDHVEDEREDPEEFEEQKEIIKYKAEATYKVQRPSQPSDTENTEFPPGTTDQPTENPAELLKDNPEFIEILKQEKKESDNFVEDVANASPENLNISKESVEIGIEIAEESLAEGSNTGKEKNVRDESLEAGATFESFDTTDGIINRNSMGRGKLSGKKKKKKNSKAYKVL